MCKGVSVLKAKLRQELFDEYELANRLRTRGEGTQEELHFMYTDPVVQLPVLHDGQIMIYEWGNRGGAKVSKLPATGWCRLESLEAGKWRWLAPEKVIIPADFGLEKSVWFPIEQGVEAVLVHDEQKRPRVYIITEPASHYFQTMTRHDRMPVLIDQKI
jgi:hypothetical protein